MSASPLEPLNGDFAAYIERLMQEAAVNLPSGAATRSDFQEPVKAPLEAASRKRGPRSADPGLAPGQVATPIAGTGKGIGTLLAVLASIAAIALASIGLLRLGLIVLAVGLFGRSLLHRNARHPSAPRRAGTRSAQPGHSIHRT